MKLSPQGREEWREGVLRFGYISFFLLYFFFFFNIFVIKKLTSLGQVSFSSDSNW